MYYSPCYTGVMIKGINAGEKNGMWSGGRWVTNKGYAKVMTKGHPRADRDGYVLEHIIAAEKKIGRLLNDKEVVHHKDGDKLNNKPDNLIVFASHGEHLKHHADIRGRATATVICDTCGNHFTKRKLAIKRYNFCNRKCMRPSLWTKGKHDVKT